jgi:hypothetical protein
MPDVTEGEFIEGQDITGNEVNYPGINSCMTLTGIANDSTLVFAGHAVMFPQEGQRNLQYMCDRIQQILNTGAENSQRIIIRVVGDIDTWEQNWGQLPETQNLRINGRPVANLQEMLTMLGFAENMQRIQDVNHVAGSDTYDVTYQSNRTCHIIPHQHHESACRSGWSTPASF